MTPETETPTPEPPAAAILPQAEAAQLTRLWARNSAKGKTYMAGRLGNAGVLVMANKDKQGPEDASHVLTLAEVFEREGGR